MTDLELERWRLRAAIQELFGAADADVSSDKDLDMAIDACAKSIQKWRHDKKEKERTNLRISLLKEIGVPVISPKKK